MSKEFGKMIGRLIDDVLEASKDAALSCKGGYGKTISEKRLDDAVNALATRIAELGASLKLIRDGFSPDQDQLELCIEEMRDVADKALNENWRFVEIPHYVEDEDHKDNDFSG